MVGVGWLQEKLYSCWETVNANIISALGQALLWCGFWLLAFVVSSWFLHQNEMLGKTTPFVITLSVIAGYGPKMMSLFMASDSDFSNFTGKRPKLTDVPWVRVAVSLLVLYLLIFQLMPAYSTNLRTEFNPANIVDFVRATFTNFWICLAIFIIQVVYSWPDVRVPIVDPLP